MINLNKQNNEVIKNLLVKINKKNNTINTIVNDILNNFINKND